MKTIHPFWVSLCLLLALCGTASAAPLQITVSIQPQKYFVEKIGSDNVEVNVMVRPGSSPATYEPQPQQMAQLSKADLYFAIGVPFERAWLPRFKSANEHLPIINLGDSVIRMPMQAHHHEDKDGHHGDKNQEDEHDHHEAEHQQHENFLADPHTWLSPPLARIMAMEIRDSLIKADEAHEDEYRKNYFKLAEEINALDQDILEMFEGTPEEPAFMVYHPSWGYFAKSYGLHQLPIEIEGKEPSPKEMAELIDLAKEHHVTAIFIQPQFSRKSAEAIASSIGAEVLIADPLAEGWADNLKKTAKAFYSNIEK